MRAVSVAIARTPGKLLFLFKIHGPWMGVPSNFCNGKADRSGRVFYSKSPAQPPRSAAWNGRNSSEKTKMLDRDRDPSPCRACPRIERRAAQRAVIFAQKIEHFLGLGGLSESGVAAQIAKDDDDVAAMAFENLLVPLRDDQLGELGREETLQPPDASQFLHQFGDPRFKPTIEYRHLVGALAQFAEQARIFHRDHRLRREVLQESDLLVRERANFLAIYADRAEERALVSQWHDQERADASECSRCVP